MNDASLVDLGRVVTLLDSALEQVVGLLEKEREIVKQLPDDLDESEIVDRMLKRPMYELAHGRVLLMEALERIRSAAMKD